MIELKVSNMSCDHCVATVTRAVQALDPGAAVTVDLGAGRVRVGGTSSEPALIKALGAAGYPATAASTQSTETPKKGCCCG